MGWKKTKIGEFLKQYKDPIEIKESNNYNLVTVSNTGNIYLRKSEIGLAIKSSKLYKIKEQSFIYSRLSIHNGAFGLVPKNLDGAVVTDEMPVFKFDEKKINKDFFLFSVKSNDFIFQLSLLTKGVGRVRVKESNFLNLEISLPSLLEQKQIAEKLKLNEEKQKNLQLQINQQKTNLKNLRKQILQDAIEGKLTKEWREKNPDIEPASELLKKIKKEKEKLISEKKIKKEKPLPAINKSEIPFELPESWVWTRLGEIGFTQTGTTPPTEDKTNFGNYVPFIKPADIKIDGIIDYLNEGLSKKGLEAGRLVIAGSVLVVCIGGSIGKLAECEIDVSCNQQINAISPVLIGGSFVKYLLSSIYFQKSIWKNASGATTPIINKSKWEKIYIPLPPLPEQIAIVSKLQTLMQKLDEVEKQIEKNLALSKQLSKAILAEAFNQNNLEKNKYLSGALSF